MADLILLTHAGTLAPETGWEAYLTSLLQSGAFDRSSTIGDDAGSRRANPSPGISGQINGYMGMRADDLANAQSFLAGHPCFEAGGTVEIRELPQD